MRIRATLLEYDFLVIKSGEIVYGRVLKKLTTSAQDKVNI